VLIIPLEILFLLESTIYLFQTQTNLIISYFLHHWTLQVLITLQVEKILQLRFTYVLCYKWKVSNVLQQLIERFYSLIIDIISIITMLSNWWTLTTLPIYFQYMGIVQLPLLLFLNIHPEDVTALQLLVKTLTALYMFVVYNSITKFMALAGGNVKAVVGEAVLRIVCKEILNAEVNYTQQDVTEVL